MVPLLLAKLRPHSPSPKRDFVLLLLLSCMTLRTDWNVLDWLSAYSHWMTNSWNNRVFWWCNWPSTVNTIRFIILNCKSTTAVSSKQTMPDNQEQPDTIKNISVHSISTSVFLEEYLDPCAYIQNVCSIPMQFKHTKKATSLLASWSCNLHTANCQSSYGCALAHLT